MTQPPERLCPACGIPVPRGQHFCSNCGTHLAEESNKPTSLSGDNLNVSNAETRLASSFTPPPPPNRYPNQPQQNNASFQGQGYQGQVPAQFPGSSPSYPNNTPYQGQGAPQAPGAPPVYATPQKGSSGSVWRRVGCIAGIILILLLGICGTAGYFVYRGANTALTNIQKTATATSGYTGTGSGNTSTDDTTPTVGPTTTTTLGTTVTYASDQLTFVNVQQAQSFPDDDSSSSAPGVLRINFKEQNTATNNADVVFSTVARLALPNGNTVEPLDDQYGSTPDASVSRTNWIDFPVATTTSPAQLTLVLGTATDAQISIPLNANADLSKYQSKTATLNKTFQHRGLNWTMLDATYSLSSSATQAKNGMMYVTIDFKIDNPSQDSLSVYWNDEMRLKSGSTVSAADSDTNFPTSYPAGATNLTGKAIFQVPQGSTSFTFILLADSSNNAAQTNVDFQIS